MSQKEEIMKMLTEHGITVKALAQSLNLKTVSAVYQTINGARRIRKIEEAITKLTGYQFPPFTRAPRSLKMKSVEEIQKLLNS